MIKSKALKLSKALKSGTYRQNRGGLKHGDKYCCLGVACEISRLGKFRKMGGLYMEQYRIFKDGEDIFLPEKVKDYFGFYDIRGSRRDGSLIRFYDISYVKNDTKEKGKGYMSLTEANDDGVSFKEIADYIENNYEFL